MAAKSKKQFIFMKAAEHSPEFAEKAEIEPSVAKEFTKENVGSKRFSKLREKVSGKKK
jgi:hypothetical protein